MGTSPSTNAGKSNIKAADGSSKNVGANSEFPLTPNPKSDLEPSQQGEVPTGIDAEQIAHGQRKKNGQSSPDNNVYNTGDMLILLPKQKNIDNSKNSPVQKQTDQKSVTNDTTVKESKNKIKENKTLESQLEERVNGITRSSHPKVQSDELNKCLKKLEDAVKLLQEKRLQKLLSLQQQKLGYLNRLSEIASVRLRHNNPDIADLSDENRATKLAEKLSELYDNEWTDVFEMTKKRSGNRRADKDIAVSLRNILKYCYDQCQAMSKNQRQKILMILCMSGENEDIEDSPDMRLTLKVFQKEAADSAVLHVQNVISTRIFNDKELKSEEIVKAVGQKLPGLYLNSCIKIAWHTQIHDPPLVLDFKGGDNPTALFRPYTSSGTILDYVLWPAMLLHEGGPIVAKGVAQFSKQSENSLPFV